MIPIIRIAAFFLVLAVSARGVAFAQSKTGRPRAARMLPRGIVLEATDILGDMSMCGTTQCVAPGWVTRKIIAAGEPLVSPAVAPPPVVLAGDSVEVVHAGKSVSLSTRGIAGNDAAVGERVTVTLVAAHVRVNGFAIASGQVRLP